MSKASNPRKLITDFAKDNPTVPSLEFITADPDGIEIKLIEGSGMVNYVYRVQSHDHSLSVIIKHGEERMRLLEEDLSLDRQDLEYDCLMLLQSIQLGSVPEPYCLDKKHNMLAMRDMSDWELLGDQLHSSRRHVDLEAATQMGYLLSKLHRQTAQENVSPEVWQEYQTKFRQKALKEYVGQFSYTRPFIETDLINKIPEEDLESYRNLVIEIKSLGLDQKVAKLWHRETCFIHADCHYKSVFIKDGQVALFDFEFAFLGLPAANLCLLVACYVFTLSLDGDHTTDPDAIPSVSHFRKQCIQAVRNLMEAYLENEVVGDSENFFSELALLTGITLFFLSTFSGVDVIMEIGDSDRGKIMRIGHQIMIDHGSVLTLDQFMDAINV